MVGRRLPVTGSACIVATSHRPQRQSALNYRPVGELVRIVGRQLVDDASRARHRRRQVVGLRVSPVAIIFTRNCYARPIGARDDDK